MLKNMKHMLHILNMTVEDGYVTSKSVSRHLGIPPMNAAKVLNYYCAQKLLKKVPALLKSPGTGKKNHYMASYEITDTGKLELERLRRTHG